MEGGAFRFVNVYAPSKLGEREGFLDDLAPVLFTNRLVVLGGFQCVTRQCFWKGLSAAGDKFFSSGFI